MLIFCLEFLYFYVLLILAYDIIFLNTFLIYFDAKLYWPYTMIWGEFPILPFLKESVYVYNDLFFGCWKSFLVKLPKPDVFIKGRYLSS